MRDRDRVDNRPLHHLQCDFQRARHDVFERAVDGALLCGHVGREGGRDVCAVVGAFFVGCGCRYVGRNSVQKV